MCVDILVFNIYTIIRMQYNNVMGEFTENGYEVIILQTHRITVGNNINKKLWSTHQVHLII